MTSINRKSVLISGAVAGVVMNAIDFVANYFTGGTLQRDLDAVNPQLWRNMNELGRLPAYIAIDFILAMLVVWLYAAIRPRFGPGPATALRSALVLWLFSGALWYLFVLMGLLSTASFLIGAAVAVLSFGGAALAGAKLYKEAE
jgi:hypothetical protein